MNKLLILLFATLCCAPQTFAKVLLISNSQSYDLRAQAGLQKDSVKLITAPLSPCPNADTVSAYAADYCWSPGTGDPTDSAWALLFGDQRSCATISAANELKNLKSGTTITGGAIFPGCDLGNPVDYHSSGTAEAEFIIEVTDQAADYDFVYSIAGENWGGDIMGGVTSLSGYLRISTLSESLILSDSLFAGVNVTSSSSAGTLQPGSYRVSYKINHTHSGTEALPWFPNGRSHISFDLSFAASPCGDLDASGRTDISDAVYLISYIFAGGPAPEDTSGGDVNCSGRTDITDSVYLISYIFGGGTAPCSACQ